MYNKNKTLLIYQSANMKDFIIKFGINYRVIINNLETGSFYLGEYVFFGTCSYSERGYIHATEEALKVLANAPRLCFFSRVKSSN